MDVFFLLNNCSWSQNKCLQIQKYTHKVNEMMLILLSKESIFRGN